MRHIASVDAWNTVLHPQDAEKAGFRIDQALKQRTMLDSDYRVVLPDGQIHWINALGEGKYDDQGQPIRMIGIILDITERQRMEAEFVRLASFPMRNPNPIVDADLSGEIRFCNPAAERMFPDLREQKLGHPFFADWVAVQRLFFETGMEECTREVSIQGRWYLQMTLPNQNDDAIAFLSGIIE